MSKYAELLGSQPNGTVTDARIGSRDNRINDIGEVRMDGANTYVPDLDGAPYLLRDGEPGLDLDAEEQPSHSSSPARPGIRVGSATFYPEVRRNGKIYPADTEEKLTRHRPKKLTRVSARGSSVQKVVTERTATYLLRHPSLQQQGHVRLRFNGRSMRSSKIDFNPTVKPGDEDYGRPPSPSVMG